MIQCKCAECGAFYFARDGHECVTGQRNGVTPRGRKRNAVTVPREALDWAASQKAEIDRVRRLMDPRDFPTLDDLRVKCGRTPLSNAERQRRYRERRKAARGEGKR